MHTYTPARRLLARPSAWSWTATACPTWSSAGGCDGNLKARLEARPRHGGGRRGGPAGGQHLRPPVHVVRRPARARAALRSGGRVGPEVAALTQHRVEVPGLGRALGAVRVAYLKAAVLVDPREHDEVAVLVKSPGPMLQITGRPATRARRTDSSSAGSSSAESPSWAAPSVMKAQAVPSEEAHPIRSDNAPASAGERSLLP